MILSSKVPAWEHFRSTEGIDSQRNISDWFSNWGIIFVVARNKSCSLLPKQRKSREFVDPLVINKQGWKEYDLHGKCQRTPCRVGSLAVTCFVACKVGWQALRYICPYRIDFLAFSVYSAKKSTHRRLFCASRTTLSRNCCLELTELWWWSLPGGQRAIRGNKVKEEEWEQYRDLGFSWPGHGRSHPWIKLKLQEVLGWNIRFT